MNFNFAMLQYLKTRINQMAKFFPIFSLIVLCFSTQLLVSEELSLFYQKNTDFARTAYEEKLVGHAKSSFEKSLILESKLTGNYFFEVSESLNWRTATIPHYHELSDLTKINFYHLLNNLCSLEGASHLHIGLLGADSFISALYGNQNLLNQQIGVDWFQECPKTIFLANCEQYLDPEKYQVLESGCFDLDKSWIKDPIDIYFYDADHSLMGHEKAITYYNDVYADVFIAVIDDWDCPWIRGATFKAFTKLNYCILYQNAIPSIGVDNGQYIAVIRKPS